MDWHIVVVFKFTLGVLCFHYAIQRLNFAFSDRDADLPRLFCYADLGTFLDRYYWTSHSEKINILDKRSAMSVWILDRLKTLRLFG